MALAIAYDDTVDLMRFRGNRRGTTGRVTQIPFFGSRDTPDLPHANLNRRDPGVINRAHFHLNDQFQIVVDGKGTLGRHHLAPYCLHFARAYTPYGPLASDADSHLTAFVLRAHFDPGSQRLPEQRETLKQISNRKPWQITRHFTFPTLQTGTGAADTILQAIPDVKDERGLAAYTLSMKPNAKTYAPDPSCGEGQYLVVLKGSLLQDNKEHKALALVFINPAESSYLVRAGSAGLEVLVLNFPRTQTLSDTDKSRQTEEVLKTRRCGLCGFVYDEAAGLPEDGIPAGTPWHDVPDSWNCPDCGAAKAEFQMIEIQD